MLGDHRPQFRTIVDRTNAGIAENQRNQASQRGRFNLRASVNSEHPRATTTKCCSAVDKMTYTTLTCRDRKKTRRKLTCRDRLHGGK